MEILPYATTWIDFMQHECIMLNKISNRERQIYDFNYM